MERFKKYVCVCVSDIEEKLQLDLRICDLTCENDTDCSGQETVKCDRGKRRQCALKNKGRKGIRSQSGIPADQGIPSDRLQGV